MRYEIAASARANDGCLVLYCTDKTIITLPPFAAGQPARGDHVLIEQIGRGDRIEGFNIKKTEALHALEDFVAYLAGDDYFENGIDSIVVEARRLTKKYLD